MAPKSILSSVLPRCHNGRSLDIFSNRTGRGVCVMKHMRTRIGTRFFRRQGAGARRPDSRRRSFLRGQQSGSGRSHRDGARAARLRHPERRQGCCSVVRRGGARRQHAGAHRRSRCLPRESHVFCHRRLGRPTPGSRPGPGRRRARGHEQLGFLRAFSAAHGRWNRPRRLRVQR